MGKWCLFATLDIIGSSGFDYEFRALESASISDNINSQEKPGPKLVNTIQSSARVVHRALRGPYL